MPLYGRHFAEKCLAYFEVFGPFLSDKTSKNNELIN
jgi:hypothetical protein